WGVACSDRVETHLGRVLLHDGQVPFYLRVTDVPAFQMAGQSHRNGRVLHWHDGAWVLLPTISNGQSGHIFDRAGRLRVIEPAPHQTTQGYRYVAADGRLVRGD